MTRVLGPRLDADAVRPLPVTAGDRPHDAEQEHEARDLGAGRVRLVGLAVQELEAVGELVVGLAQHGHDEQRDETEVEERVHEARGGIAQQRLHPHAVAVALRALLDVLARRAAVVGEAAFVVLDAQRREPRDDEQHRGDGAVERDLHRGGDVDEDLALHVRVVVPARDRGHDPARDHEHEHRNADAENDLMSLGPSHRAEIYKPSPNCLDLDDDSPRGDRSNGRSACAGSSPHLAPPQLASEASLAASHVQGIMD